MTMRRNQSGAALITAIFIMAVTATIAMALLVTQRQLIQQAELVVGHDALYSAAAGLRLWAQGSLMIYLNASHQQNAPASAFVLPSHYTGPATFHQIQLSGHFVDQQGLFNINNLTQTAGIPPFIRLIEAVSPEISSSQAKAIALNTSLWMQQKSHDDYYLRLNPPYHAGHQQMADISELRLVEGMTPVLFQRLKPYITAYPINMNTQGGGDSDQAENAINVNTAPAQVLMTLSPVISIDKAQDLVACRKGHPVFATLSAYEASCVVPTLGANTTLKGITLTSAHMLFIAEAQRGRQSVTLTDYLLGIPASDGASGWSVRVLWQSL